MCFNQTEHEIKGRCGFCDILSQTLLLYLCKIQCMYACKCFCPNVATSHGKKKRKEKKEKKSQAHSSYCVEIFTSNLLNEEKSFICDIFRDICSSMVYLNNKKVKQKTLN